MKKKLTLLVSFCLFSFFLISFSVDAEETKEETTVRMGNTGINAMEDTMLAYENGSVYACLDGEHGYSVYKYTLSTGTTEKIYNMSLHGLNVIDGIVYGYSNFQEDNEEKSALWKVDTNDDNQVTLVKKVESPSNILVVEDIIYFLTENEYGDTSLCKVKVDGSDYSVYLEKQIRAFTVYKNELYILTDEGLFKVEDTNGNMNYVRLDKELHIMTYTSFTIVDDIVYIRAYGYKDNKEEGLYTISLNEKNKVQLIPDTNELFEFDVTKEAVLYVNDSEELIKISLDGKQKEKICQSYDVFELASYDQSIYLLNYEYLNDNFNDEVWQIATDGSKEKRLFPTSNDDYDKIKEILTKTSKVMKTVKRYDVQLAVADDRKEDQQTAKFDATFRIDNNVKVMNETIHLQVDSEEVDKQVVIRYNEWADSQNIYASRDNGPWRLEEYSDKNEPQYERLFELFSFIDNGSDYCSKLRVSDNSTQYILQGESSYGRVLETIEQSYWLHFFMNGLSSLGTFDFTIHINKNNYRIEQLNISYKDVDEENTMLRELAFEAKNNYNVSNTLMIPSNVTASMNKLGQANNYIEKAKKAIEEEKPEVAIKYCDAALKVHELAIHAYEQKGIALIQQGELNEAIEQFELFLTNQLFEDSNPVYMLLADVYNHQLEYETAKKYLYELDWDKIKPKDDLDTYIDYLMTFCRTYSGLKNYTVALNYAEKAINLEANNSTANIMKLALLFQANKHLECLEFAEELLTKEDFARDRTVFYYIGKSNLMLGNKQEAIRAYQEALKCEEKLLSNSMVYFDLGLYYCWVGKYSMAKLYADRMDKDYKHFQDYLMNIIEEGKKPLAYKVGNFILNNYLYLNDSDVTSTVNKFQENEEATVKDIDTLITKIKQPDDRFTFLLSGDSLEEYDNSEEITHQQIDETTEYIKVSSFLNHSGTKFISLVEAIEKPYTKTLIIDLRGNSGGLIGAATDMLDVLLPECTPCYLVDRSGKTIQIQSDDYHVPFKAIKVLVDYDSASSSELLALGLRKFLDNVEILGKTTYGKGVGQTIYADEKGRFQLFLVSFYWNILQENIDGVGIEPDVEVEGTELEDFLQLINSGESD